MAGALGYLIAGAGLRPIERMRARATTILRAAPRSGCRFLRRTTSCVGLPIEASPVDLVALAARVANRFQAAAGGRAIRVTAPRPVAIQGDATRLDRALSNLIDNALRHGAGDIAIDIRTTGGAADLTVTDEGAGFAAHDTSPSDGNGLGLTIVREIVRAHGGTVEVRRAGDRTRVRVALETPRL